MASEISKGMINKALSKLNPQAVSDLLKELVTSVSAIWENQTQMSPAIISLWDKLEYLDRKLDYQTGLIQKDLRDNKLSYEEFTEQAPEPHISMKMEK